MRELDPRIDLQEELNRQIWNVLQGNAIENIRKNCEGSVFDLNYRSVMEGNSLRVQ